MRVQLLDTVCSLIAATLALLTLALNWLPHRGRTGLRLLTFLAASLTARYLPCANP